MRKEWYEENMKAQTPDADAGQCGEAPSAYDGEVFAQEMKDNGRTGYVAHQKYVTFKTNDLFELLGKFVLPPFGARNELFNEMHSFLSRENVSVSPDRLVEFCNRMTGWEVDCAPIAQSVTAAVEKLQIDDAVVIRRQDVFSAPALDAYANSIQVALELDEQSTTEPNPRKAQLRRIADYFHSEAEKAWNTNRKLPD